jgi:hypothetical protein
MRLRWRRTRSHDQTILYAALQAAASLSESPPRQYTGRSIGWAVAPIMRPPRIRLLSLPLGVFTLLALTLLGAEAQTVSRVQDIGNLRLGQRIKVDDGTCPAGQIKEVSGAKMGPTGVLATQKCIPRTGPKTK